MAALAGILVGGRGRRMGGVAKGLLVAPSGETIVERWLRVLRAHDLEVVLLGDAGPYAHLGIEALADERGDHAVRSDGSLAALGPIGGAAALLARAAPTALLVGCDMPHVSSALVGRLLAHAPEAAVVAPWVAGRWQTMLARLDRRALPEVRRRLSLGEARLQALFEACGAVALPLSAAEELELRDWDTPADLARDGAGPPWDPREPR